MKKITFVITILASTALLMNQGFAQSETDTPNALPPANAESVEIYVKYDWGYGLNGMWTSEDPLILFPDGTAFSAVPEEGAITTFDAASLRAAFTPENRAEHVGTWKRAREKLILIFEDETRRLPKTDRGWWDGDGAPDPESAYNTYFPIIPATEKDLVGPWVTKNLTLSGTPGGALPSVASGSTTNRVFYADGTFSEDSERFVSATNANVGEPYQTGTTVGMFSKNEGQAAGRWRIDGPLLTIERDGQRAVLLAFIMPHWDKDNPGSDTWIDGDRWERPEAEE